MTDRTSDAATPPGRDGRGPTSDRSRETESGTRDGTSPEAEADFSADTLLAVRNLSTRFYTSDGQVNAVESLSFDLRRGEVLGIVGESGSGKSVTGLSILDLVESPGRIADGEIWFRDLRLAERHRDGRPDAVRGPFVDLCRLPAADWHRLRGRSFSMIFQDPMSSFSPTHAVGEQIAEAVEVARRSEAASRSNRDGPRDYGLPSMALGTVLRSRRFVSEASRRRAVELLENVGIPDPENRADEFPHQFSGGMLQRAMIAMALAGEPDLLIADEPTTALDVTIQAQILDLLSRLQQEGDMGIVFITHDLGVIARVADRIGVMYAGEIVERGTPEDIFEDHVHPYTAGLLGSTPDTAAAARSAHRLTPIEGNVPSLLDHEMGDGCYFADRCPKAMEDCLTRPPEYEPEESHGVRCYLADREFAPDRALDADRAGGDGP